MMEHWTEITRDEEESGPFVIDVPACFSLLLLGLNCPTRAHYGNQTECMSRNQSQGEPSQEL